MYIITDSVYAFLSPHGSLFTQGRASHSVASDQARQSSHLAIATALHLLRSGGDINTIRARLGHVSLEATNRYAQLDLKVKVRVLRGCAENLPGTEAGAKPSWNCDEEFVSFLAFL